jgi:hypothetical protein
MRLTTAHIDWLNIVLLIMSAAAAFVLPFEVFLFSYAVLGPLHYLTEISWLHERNYFAQERRDAGWLLVLAAGLFFVSFWQTLFTPGPLRPAEETLYAERALRGAAAIIYLAFMAAVAMVLFRRLSSKLAFLLLTGVFLLGLSQLQAWVLLFAVFLPTLIHVYVFTAAFMLLGALRGRSIPGLLAFSLLIGVGTWLLLYRPETPITISDEVRKLYEPFVPLNNWFARLLGSGKVDVFTSPLGIAMMRFIAFAYTYHYLNWFSKTSIIRWHQVDRTRLICIVALWLLAVALYGFDYRVGFIALYTLSFMHVFLEFPLNWRSFIDLGREVSVIRRAGWSKPQAIRAMNTTPEGSPR